MNDTTISECHKRTDGEMERAKNLCGHCRGAKYVFVYWLERALEQRGMHLTEVPPDLFTLIPVEYFLYCHCDARMIFFGKNRAVSPCQECEGVSWRFTEEAHRAGYRWKKAGNLSLEEVSTLPCEYFERCPCADEDQSPKGLKRRELLKGVFDLIGIKIPVPNVAF